VENNVVGAVAGIIVAVIIIVAVVVIKTTPYKHLNIT
jgi:hypothetical protein